MFGRKVVVVVVAVVCCLQSGCFTARADRPSRAAEPGAHVGVILRPADLDVRGPVVIDRDAAIALSQTFNRAVSAHSADETVRTSIGIVQTLPGFGTPSMWKVNVETRTKAGVVTSATEGPVGPGVFKVATALGLGCASASSSVSMVMLSLNIGLVPALALAGCGVCGATTGLVFSGLDTLETETGLSNLVVVALQDHATALRRERASDQSSKTTTKTTTPTTPTAPTPTTGDVVTLEDKAHWFYGVDDQRKGPVTLEQLQELGRTKTIAADSLVWRPGYSAWRPFASATAPPRVPPGAWFYGHEDRRVGPVEGRGLADALVDGVITAETLVWAEGMANWVPARDVAAFQSALAQIDRAP